MSILHGEVIDNRYQIEQFLGAGGMASVYLATDVRDPYAYALKFLHQGLLEDQDLIQRFTAEAKRLSKLQHPNIVRFYDFVVSPQHAYIVMDYIQGYPLSQLLRLRRERQEGPLPLEATLSILQQMNWALTRVHEEGLVHRDIKSGNILIRDSDGRVFLSDLGIAKELESVEVTRGTIGTRAYMAPEQYRNEKVSPATDVYALGIIAFELLTGDRPFRGSTATNAAAQDSNSALSATRDQRLLEEHLYQEPPSISEIVPGIPPAVDDVIRRAMAKQSEARYPTVAEFAHALHQAMLPILPDTLRDLKQIGQTRGHFQTGGEVFVSQLPGGGSGANAPAAPYGSPPPQQRRAGLLTGLAAAVVILLVGLGLLVVGAAGSSGAATTPTENATAVAQAVQQTLEAGTAAALAAMTDTPQPSATFTLTATPTLTGTPAPTNTAALPDTPQSSDGERVPEISEPGNADDPPAQNDDSGTAIAQENTSTPTDTPAPTGTAAPTATPTFTETPTPTATSTATPTATETATAAPTSTETPPPTSTRRPSDTPVPTITSTHTPEPTETPTVTPSKTPTATVTPSPTASPTVTPVPTATPVVMNNSLPGYSLYEDDFSSPQTNLWQPVSTSRQWSASDEALLIQPNTANTPAELLMVYQPEQQARFTLTLQLAQRLSAAPADARAGMVLRYQNTDGRQRYYVYGVELDQEAWFFALYTESGAEKTRETITGGELPAGDVDWASSVIELAVLADGNSYAFAVNGEDVGQIRDDRLAAGGHYGVINDNRNTPWIAFLFNSVRLELVGSGALSLARNPPTAPAPFTGGDGNNGGTVTFAQAASRLRALNEVLVNDAEINCQRYNAAYGDVLDAYRSANSELQGVLGNVLSVGDNIKMICFENDTPPSLPIDDRIRQSWHDLRETLRDTISALGG